MSCARPSIAKVVAAQMRNACGAAGGARRKREVYFNLALRLLAPPSPVLVAIGGLSGTGKSTVARALARILRPSPVR
jgi:2-phosphoglycerate kinase